MLAKLIAHAPSRAAAVAQLADALDATVCWGVTTNRGFLARVLRDPAFGWPARSTPRSSRAASPTMQRARRRRRRGSKRSPPHRSPCCRARRCPRSGPAGRRRRHVDVVVPIEVAGATRTWRLVGHARPRSTRAAVTRRIASPHLSSRRERRSMHSMRARRWPPGPRRRPRSTAPSALARRRRRPRGDRPAPARRGASRRPRPALLLAPLHGRVTEACVAPGATVAAGALLVVIEAMKMEHQIRAPHAGTIAALHVAPATRSRRASRSSRCGHERARRRRRRRARRARRVSRQRAPLRRARDRAARRRLGRSRHLSARALRQGRRGRPDRPRLSRAPRRHAGGRWRGA